MVSVEGQTTAPADVVWKVLSDVEDWPRWMPTMYSVRPVDGGAPRVGARYRVHQPAMPPLTWRVTDWTEGRGFTWSSRGPGLVTTGVHVIDQVDGGVSVRLGITWTGLLAPLARRLYAAKAADYLRQELAALQNQVAMVAAAATPADAERPEDGRSGHVPS